MVIIPQLKTLVLTKQHKNIYISIIYIYIYYIYIYMHELP